MHLGDIWTEALSILAAIWAFAQTQFFTSIVGAGFGSAAGALAAQHIAEREKFREAIIKEMRNTNAAITLAATIVERALALKEQLIKPIFDNYTEQRIALAAHIKEANTGSATGPFDTEFDFRSIPMLPAPAEALQKLVVDRISLSGRPIMVAITLIQTIEQLNRAINKREAMIQAHQNAKLTSNETTIFYFGLKTLGKADTSYPDVMGTIASNTDDVLYFSDLLCRDLEAHANEKRGALGKRAPKIAVADFSNAKKRGLFPDAKLYPNWEAAPDVRSK